MIPVAASVRVWIASGHTDMRKGMNGLALLVQEGLGRDPFAGDVFVFRGRAGSLIKALWHDGIGIRYKTPVGPIRVDFSYNLNPPIYPVFDDYTGALPYVGQASHFNFFFSIGQSF